ncbi:MAG: beta-1,6-N-acetylglucosaminyltransferase [Faecousia sp.]
MPDKQSNEQPYGRMGRHAYLIISHQNFKQLEILMSLLDYEANDIYVHIDKKSKLSGFEREKLKRVLRHSEMSFVKSRKVSWGADSLMKVEITLLQEATKRNHVYYHLLSGADLPLKTQSYIHEKLNRDGRDYIALETNRQPNITKSFLDRFRYFYFLQNQIDRNKEKSRIRKVQSLLLSIQKSIGIDRTKRANFEYVKGSQWFSITHDTALYIIDRYPQYKKYFIRSFIPDESFLQTIVKNAPLRDHVVDDNLRYIDWKRGSPYVFRDEDYDILMKSEKLFARKFDTYVDQRIILRIQQHLKSNAEISGTSEMK